MALEEPGKYRHRLLLPRFLAIAAGKHAGRSLKNCFGILAGRKASAHPDDLFLRQYILHLTGIRPIRYITCSGLESEGAGAQAHLIMNAINFARAIGLPYIHTPFHAIPHADRPMQEWVTGWETLFNLGAGETDCSAVANIRRGQIADFCHNAFGLELCFGWHHRRKELAERFRALIPDLRRKYYDGKLPRTTEEFTVAVHIRRGDVSEVRNARRFTSLTNVRQTVAEVKSILDSQGIRYRIGVYSQGNPGEFEDLAPLGAEMFLDVDALSTMRELIEADILVMAKGFFSNYAGIISDGIKLFDPAGLPKRGLPAFTWWILAPNEDCLPCRPDGSFDRVSFERQLSRLVEAKSLSRLKG